MAKQSVSRAGKAQSDPFPSSIEQRFLRCICSLGVLSQALEHQGNTDSCLTVKFVASELYTVYEEVDGAVRLPDRVDVRLTACSPKDKAAILKRLRNTLGWSAGDLNLETLIDDVANDVTQALPGVPVAAARALVHDLDAIGVDACIELTAGSLRGTAREVRL